MQEGMAVAYNENNTESSIQHSKFCNVDVFVVATDGVAAHANRNVHHPG
jgi:hypothetical protein